MTWPVAALSPAARARAIAAAVPSAALAEVDIDAPFDEVWDWLSDIEHSVPQFDFEVSRLRVLRREGNRLDVEARAPFLPIPFRFDAVLEPGWCFMRARFRLYLVVMTATPLDGGRRTRVTHVEGIPLPFTRWLRPVLQRIVRGDVRGIARHFASLGPQ